MLPRVALLFAFSLVAHSRPVLAQRATPLPAPQHTFALLAHAPDSLRVRDEARRLVESKLEHVVPDLVAASKSWRSLWDLLETSAYPPCYCEFFSLSDARQLAIFARTRLLLEVLVERDRDGFRLAARLTHAERSQPSVHLSARGPSLFEAAIELAGPLAHALRGELGQPMPATR
jgi:hypothetical protein